MPSAIDYLGSTHREPMPTWLADFDQHALARPSKVLSEFLASRHVYYPGSGSDGSPVALFNSAQAAACFVYVDLLLEHDALLRELSDNGFRGYRTLKRVELHAADFSISRWQPHLTPAEMAGAPEPVPPYGFIEILEKFDPDVPGYARIAIIFLRADGHAAYDALYCQGMKSSPAPFAIVIQDHGSGGNWSPFGKGGAMHVIATRADVFPGLLLVADNSEAWDGFAALEGVEAQDGQHLRSVFGRNT